MARLTMSRPCNVCGKVTTHEARAMTWQNGKVTSEVFVCTEPGHWEKVRQQNRKKAA